MLDSGRDPIRVVVEFLLAAEGARASLEAIDEATEWQEVFEPIFGDLREFLEAYTSLLVVSPVGGMVTFRDAAKFTGSRRVNKSARNAIMSYSESIGHVSCCSIAKGIKVDELRSIYHRRGLEARLIDGVILHVAYAGSFDLFAFAEGAVVCWGNQRSDHWVVEADFMTPNPVTARTLIERHEAGEINELFPIWWTYSFGQPQDDARDEEAEREREERLTEAVANNSLAGMSSSYLAPRTGYGTDGGSPPTRDRAGSTVGDFPSTSVGRAGVVALGRSESFASKEPDFYARRGVARRGTVDHSDHHGPARRERRSKNEKKATSPISSRAGPLIAGPVAVPEADRRRFTSSLPLDHFVIPESDRVNVMTAVSCALAQSVTVDYLEARISELSRSALQLPQQLRLPDAHGTDGAAGTSTAASPTADGSSRASRAGGMLGHGGRATEDDLVTFEDAYRAAGNLHVHKTAEFALIDEPLFLWERPRYLEYYDLAFEHLSLRQRADWLRSRVSVMGEALSAVAAHVHQQRMFRADWFLILLLLIDSLVLLTRLVVAIFFEIPDPDEELMMLDQVAAAAGPPGTSTVW